MRPVRANEIPQATDGWTQPLIEVGDPVVVYMDMACDKARSFLDTVARVDAANRFVETLSGRKCYHRSCPFITDGHLKNASLWEDSPHLARAKRMDIKLERLEARTAKLEAMLATVAPNMMGELPAVEQEPTRPVRLTPEEIEADQRSREAEAVKIIEELVVSGVTGAAALMKHKDEIRDQTGLHHKTVEKLIRGVNEEEILRRSSCV